MSQRSQIERLKFGRLIGLVTGFEAVVETPKNEVYPVNKRRGGVEDSCWALVEGLAGSSNYRFQPDMHDD